MKRNFLLMLLLTLLPFAGWAVDVKIGDYTATLSYQYVALTDAETGVDAPAITLKKGETSIAGTPAGVWDATGKEVEGKIKASGVYYSLVKFTDGSAKTIKVPFRVYAPTELVEVTTLYPAYGEYAQQSIATDLLYGDGPYTLYYQEYPWCDVWYQYGNSDEDGVILFPGETPDETSTTHKGGTSHAVNGTDWKPEDATTWYEGLVATGTDWEGKIKHSWRATIQSNPNNIGFLVIDEDKSIIVCKVDDGDVVQYATPWGHKAFGANYKKYGLFDVVNDLRNEFHWESGVPEFDDIDFTINKLKFEKLEGSVLSNEPGEYTIQVTPISGVRMPYGGEIDLSPANAKNVISLTPIEYNTIPGLKEAIMEAGVLQVNGIDGDINPENWKKLVPGTYTYSLGIKDTNEPFGTITKEETLVTLEGDARTFIIDPILDGQVIIEAGQNDFAKDEEGNYKLPVLKTGLVYSGSAQSLVEASAAETVFGTGIEYLVISSTYEGLEIVDGIPSIPEEILGAEWRTTAEGTNAGKYYVWARAAAAPAGGDDEGNWEAGEPHLLSVAAIEGSNEEPANYAEIEKATPTIVWEDKSSVAAKYYKNKFEDGKVIVSPTGAKVQFNGQDLEGAKITYVFKKGSNTLGSILTSTSYTINNSEVGKDYKVIARFSIKDDNVNKNFKQNFKSITGNDDPKATFEIKAMPDVTITPTAPQLIGFGTNPVFTYEGEGGVVWEDGEEGTLTGTAQYRWYSDENCQTRVPTTSTPAEGEYYVKIHEGLTCETHNIVYKPFKVLVTSGDIEAEIADHTGDDALIYGQPLPLTLEHITGLAEAQVANFERHPYTNGEFIAKNKVTGVETPLKRENRFDQSTWSWYTLDTPLPVGTYTVTANIETEGFQVFVDAGEWEVVAKDITNEDTGTEGLYVYGLGNEFNLVKGYAGAPIIPTAEDLSAGNWGISYRYEKLKFDEVNGELIVPGDLEISPIEGKNNTNAGTAYFLISGKGNFTGEKEMAFTIDKAIMNVKPAAGQKWTVGTPEPEYALDVENIQSQLKGMDRAKDDDGNDQETALDITTAAGFKDLTVKRVSNTTVGNHTDALVAYQKVDEETGEIVPADNYEFKFDNANEDLVIEPGTINLKVKDVTVTYAGKDQKPEFDYEFTLADGTTLSDLMKQDGNWQRLITGLNSDEIEWFRDDDEVEMLYNARTYTDFFGCTVPDGTFKATNYTVTLTKNEGTLTIAPAPVTLKAADQGPMELDDVETKFDAVASVYNSENKQGTVIVTGEIYDPIDELAAIQKPAVVKVGENEITLVPSNNSNYDITPQNGTLFVGTKEGDLVLALTSQMEDYEVPVVNLLQNAANSDELAVTAEIKTVTKPGDWSKLKAYEGVPVDMITLQLKPATLSGNADFSAWNADEWHAMVLPFEITVKELSKAFDYAYVNVVDPTATKANDVRFKLANILDVIPANTPFCIKASVPYEYETRTTEGDVTEVTPAQVLEFIPTTTGKTDETEAKFTIDLTGIATEGEGAWTVAGVDADNENLGYKFAGIYDELTIDKDTKDALRFLGTVGGVNKWYYIGDASTKTCTLPPYTGFVNLGAKTADVREVTFTFEEEDGSTTSIKAVDFFNGFNANDEVYTVDGMKVNAPTQKGVYIKNGKKVLVK